MSGTKLTDKTALTEQLASIDLLMVVDKSDGTGSADGTSKAVQSKYIIQTDTKTGNLDLATSPLTLVPSPGAGYFIQPLCITIIFKYGTTAQINTGYAYINYDATNTTNYIVRARDLYRNETADRTYIYGTSVTPADGTYAGTIEDKALYLHGIDLTGDSTFKVYTTYQIVKE